MANLKTYSQKPSEIERTWLLIDASEAPVGRIATQVARLLVGKDKPTYTPHIDAGDYVVVINAAKAVFTGNKEVDKKYYRHSGFPGNLRELSVKQVREKAPERLIENAVRGMLPKNKLQAERMKRLRIFADENHEHTAQQPAKVEVK